MNNKKTTDKAKTQDRPKLPGKPFFSGSAPDPYHLTIGIRRMVEGMDECREKDATMIRDVILRLGELLRDLEWQGDFREAFSKYVDYLEAEAKAKGIPIGPDVEI